MSLADDGRRAFKIVGTVFDDIIVRLRRDPRFSSVSTFEFELLLANERAKAEHTLFGAMRGRVHTDDIADFADDEL
jgi:hypothetical protein